jgi:2-polyprenyl-3-methyl-5-hydroxy-6-metoxy-1,4-benzoquinol methylase
MADLGNATPAFDDGRSQNFAERMVQAINHGALTLMTSVGHRTGLFDTMAGMPKSSSRAIAEASGLDERYVREWLSAMVTGQVVDYDVAAQTYRLPPEHAAWLTRAASPNNLSVAAQFVPLLARAEDSIVTRFREGGGTDYCEYCGFHHVMAEESAQSAVAPLFDAILPLVPTLMAELELGIDVLDAGCGSGRVLLAMAARYPRSRFVGYDLCEEPLEAARAEAKRLDLCNVRFEARDLTAFNEPRAFDLVTTFDAVHDQKDPQGLLSGIARALRPGGVYLMQDIGGSSHLERNMEHPLGTYLYTISCMHCMAVSLGQGGAGLGAMWGVELAEQMLRKAGFDSIEMHRLPHDPVNVYVVSRTE